MQKYENISDKKKSSLRSRLDNTWLRGVTSGTRTHDIQNHNLTL